MMDFHVYADLREEAKGLGYSDIGIIGGPGLNGDEINAKSLGELRERVKRSKADYTIYNSADSTVSRKCPADVLSLDFEKLVFDDVIAKSAEFVEFDLYPIIFSSRRMAAMQSLQKALGTARKGKCRILATTKARDRYGLRGPRDMAAFLKVLGFRDGEVKDVLAKNPELLMKRIKKRKDPKYVREGVSLE